MIQAMKDLNIPGANPIKTGKVRNIYDLGRNLLMVATDRISAFDVVMPDPVPDKGKVLTQLSIFWLEAMKDIVDNHFISDNVENLPPLFGPYLEDLRGRSMIVRKAVPLEIECVVRGYISGSGWKSYRSGGTVCGIELPKGLVESEKLPEPLFTPSTKAEEGHDENIDFDTAAEIVGRPIAEKVRDLSLAIYKKGAALAAKKGIIIADTKFEFGFKDGRFILIDEVLSPDSSRFWPVDKYVIGKGQPSFDKQPIRDYLASTGWDKKPPAPRLPDDVVEASAKRYREAQRLLTGK